MALLQSGSLRLFRLAGIDVMIHWSWLILAVVETQFRPFQQFQSPVWRVAEFLSMFGIVLLHEIGHVTACRQVGGTAERIILWPLGGIAVVNPPPRPWPWFWSVAGGPLMNVVLVPVLGLFMALCFSQGWAQQSPDLKLYLWSLNFINLFLLVFNLVPLYPNDGGQMLHAMLWAVIGRWPALMATSLIGMIGGVLVGFLCLAVRQWFLGFFAVMLILRSAAAFTQARRMSRIMNSPRHRDARCPACSAHPLLGDHWVCDECGCRFDTFETLAECPKCFKRFEETMCVECGRKHSIIDWFPRTAPQPAPEPAIPATPARYRPTEEWDQVSERDYS